MADTTNAAVGIFAGILTIDAIGGAPGACYLPSYPCDRRRDRPVAAVAASASPAHRTNA